MTRLVFIIILFLISLLAVFKAPAYYLWMLAIGVTEFPWVFIGLTLFSLVRGYWYDRYVVLGTMIGLVALALYISPIVRAYKVSATLNKNFNASFGIKSADTAHGPFSFFNMFKSTPKVAYRTLTYVHYADTSLTLDFYPSLKAGKRPCVVVIHGGSWASGDSQELPPLDSYLAEQGYHVASINYRLAPKYQSPAPVEDVANALKYLEQHAAEMHIDTNNFVLLGRSAGGQIALLAGYTLHKQNIKAIVNFYGVADMVWGYSLPSSKWIMDSRKVMGQYVGGTYAQVPQKFAATSPVEFVSPQSPPTLIIHGDNDALVSNEHSRRLDAKLQAAGVKHFWLRLPWATHGFDFNLHGPGGQLSTYTILKFLKNICPPAS